MGIMEKKMETAITGDIGSRVLGLPKPSNVVPFWVWYGLLVRTIIRNAKKVLHWR